MKFIYGYKQSMTQVYKEDGTVVPVTVVRAEPCIVTQVKSNEKDGYNALQLGVGTRNRVAKPQQGHMKAVTETGRKPFDKLQEVRVSTTEQYNVGDTISVSTFVPGDKVAVTGTSKGKGFQGVVKRHGFAGSPASHGHKDQLRMPGSIGSQEPQRVFKGTRMGGRMGTDQVTVLNLEIVQVDAEQNLIYVKGALPGARSSFVLIKGDGDLEVSGNIFKTTEVPAEKEEAEPVAEESTNEAKEEAPKEDAPVEKAEVKEEEPAATESEEKAE